MITGTVVSSCAHRSFCAVFAVAILLGLAACATPAQRPADVPAPTGHVKPVETALTDPVTFCDRILVGGALARDIKTLNNPAKCTPIHETTFSGIQLAAKGWSGTWPTAHEAEAHAIITHINLFDLPAVIDAPRVDLPANEHNNLRVEPVLSELAAQSSSATIRVDGIAKMTSTLIGRPFVEVGAVIMLAPTHFIEVQIARTAAASDDAAIRAEARSIIENDLPQISGKQ